MRKYITIFPKKTRGTWICKWHVNGKPKEQSFNTKKEAEEHKDFIAKQLKESGTDGIKYDSLDNDTKIRMYRVHRYEQESGNDVFDIIKEYERIQASKRKQISVTDAVAECLNDKEKEGCDARTLQSLRSPLNRFKFRHPRKVMHNIEDKHILDFVDGMDISGRTRLGYLTDLRTLFSWALQKGYVNANPVLPCMPTKSARKKIMNQKRARRKEQVLTPDECQLILVYCEKNYPEITRYAVPLMFAGLRPEKEGTLIDWDDITEESITVDETIAKDGETRIIEPLTLNLIEWIKVLRERGIEPLTNLKRKWNKVKSVIGRTWPHDALRHTYASYHYAMFKDAGLTAKNLGHPNPTLLRKDYNNAVTEKEAKKFWAIMP